MKKSDRFVYKHPNGWAEKRVGDSRAGSIHQTQRDAELTAKDKVRRSGGGEVSTQGMDGKIRSKDTVKPGNDPFPPRDKEH